MGIRPSRSMSNGSPLPRGALDLWAIAMFSQVGTARGDCRPLMVSGRRFERSEDTTRGDGVSLAPGGRVAPEAHPDISWVVSAASAPRSPPESAAHDARPERVTEKPETAASILDPHRDALPPAGAGIIGRRGPGAAGVRY